MHRSCPIQTRLKSQMQQRCGKAQVAQIPGLRCFGSALGAWPGIQPNSWPPTLGMKSRLLRLRCWERNKVKRHSMIVQAITGACSVSGVSFGTVSRNHTVLRVGVVPTSGAKICRSSQTCFPSGPDVLIHGQSWRNPDPGFADQVTFTYGSIPIPGKRICCFY